MSSLIWLLNMSRCTAATMRSATVLMIDCSPKPEIARNTMMAMISSGMMTSWSACFCKKIFLIAGLMTPASAPCIAAVTIMQTMPSTSNGHCRPI